MDKGYDYKVTIWPRKYKRKHTYFFDNLTTGTKQNTEKGG